MSASMIEADWRSPARQARPAAVAQEAQPLILVAEQEPRLTPMVEDLCGFLRVRALRVPPEGAADGLREHAPVGLLCHAERTDASLAEVLRAVVAVDPGLPVMVVTEHDPSREARLAVAAEIIRLDHLVWLEHMPDLRRMVDFLFLAERRGGRAGAAPG